MKLSVELEPELERALARCSAADGMPKSVIVKRALSAYLAREPVSAYEAGKDLFGRYGSGEGDLSGSRRERFEELMSAKRRRR